MNTKPMLTVPVLLLALQAAAQRPPTFIGDVQPILERNCRECHFEGAPLAPMALDAYAQVRPWAKSIHKQVASGAMPPWHAVAPKGAFANERGLSEAERKTIVAWLEAGAPRGSGPEPVREHTPQPAWRIGDPDLVLDAGTEFAIPAEGEIPYQTFTVAFPENEDRWVKAIEVLPTDYEHTEQISVYVKNPPGEGEIPDAGPYGRGLLASYFRGHCERTYPENAGKLIRAGAELIFQAHYVANGKPGVDRPRVAFRFHDGPVANHVVTRGIANADFVIPPHEPAFEIRAAYTLKTPAKILALRPQMRARGSRFQFIATDPAGHSEVLLDVNPYRYRWQVEYVLKKPVELPAGTTIECVAIMDNSHENVRNPDSHAYVRPGTTQADEVMIGWIDYVERKP